MPEDKDSDRYGSNRIESWEIELAQSVARSFRTFLEREDLEGELFKKLADLKSREHPHALNWRSFLAKSLYNAARDYIRLWKIRQRNISYLDFEFPSQEGEGLSTLEEMLAAPPDSIDSRLEFEEVWSELSPEIKELWLLLAQEGGNQAAVARKLGKPVDTVKYWFKKIRRTFQKRGLR
ncbi:MAG: sigma-70 family RNA polymerase sigma factor [Elusimicrobia bacterium]|nr:sigma-70 family RNA polymerase sigma factor [Elusimicrobiota bacterium]